LPRAHQGEIRRAQLGESSIRERLGFVSQHQSVVAALHREYVVLHVHNERVVGGPGAGGEGVVQPRVFCQERAQRTDEHPVVVQQGQVPELRGHKGKQHKQVAGGRHRHGVRVFLRERYAWVVHKHVGKHVGQRDIDGLQPWCGDGP